MENGKRMEKSGLTDWVQESETAHVGPEIESPKIELWAAASRQQTSNVEKAHVGRVPQAAMETLATTSRKSVSSSLETMPQLRSGPTEAADTIQETEDELWEKIRRAVTNTDQVSALLMQFNEDIRANDNIISEVKKKLSVQKHEVTEIGVKNVTDTSNKSVNRTNEADTSQIEVLRVLGTGAFGTVYLVRKKGGADDGRLYAMKVLEKASVIQEDVTEDAVIERRVLEAVRHHPFLITLHYVFQTDFKLYLVLDYMAGGNLLTISYDRMFTQDEVRFYISEIILALEHLHKLGIMHRDVKLENILLASDGHAVLSDFGLSRMFLPDEGRQAHSMCGTTGYMAPEVIETTADGYDMAVDWWSLGIVTHELLTGVPPFETRIVETNKEKLNRITELSSDAADFISKLLVKDPRKRLGAGTGDAEELKRHPFLKGINWSDLAQKKISPPFVPPKTNELDVSNFKDEFTQSSSADLPPNCDDIFRKYLYVLPSVLCGEYAVSGEVIRLTAELPELTSF
jgi:serine/threonine protein kinase